MQEKIRKLTKLDKWKLSPYRLAHHPLCHEFDDHVYIIKGKKVCRGCVNLYIGMIAGLLLIIVVALVPQINYWITFVTMLVLFIFTPISAFLDLPRIIKDISRFFLGIALIAAFTAITLSVIELTNGVNWWAFSIIIITLFLYFFSKSYFTRYRDRKNEQVCKDCDQFYQPRCDGMAAVVDKTKALESRIEGDAFSEQ